MSCATLKRPLDSDLFSPPSSRPSAAKRRRLAAAARGLFGIGKFGASSPSSTTSSSPSSSPHSTSTDGTSPFALGGSPSKLSPEQMQCRLRQEIRHLRRLKQLQYYKGDDSIKSLPTSHVSLDNFGESLKNAGGKDAPLFTFKQVGLICERLLQEKEDALRREYEQVLSNKLAEQYDTFVKFTHDQIQKRFEAASAPSYLS